MTTTYQIFVETEYGIAVLGEVDAETPDDLSDAIDAHKHIACHVLGADDVRAFGASKSTPSKGRPQWGRCKESTSQKACRYVRPAGFTFGKGRSFGRYPGDNPGGQFKKGGK